MKLIAYISILVALLFFVGCAPCPRYLPAHRIVAPTSDKVEKSKISTEEASGNLLGTINCYIGTPYVYGGEDKYGMDCSGFVQTVFREALSIKLPRTVAQQWKAGKSISDDELAFGDLAFFKTSKKKAPSHIGIYIGARKFAHASSSLGVTISQMSDKYWAKRYVGARRIILR